MGYDRQGPDRLLQSPGLAVPVAAGLPRWITMSPALAVRETALRFITFTVTNPDPNTRHPTALVIAGAVSYMSVHTGNSRTPMDSAEQHGPRSNSP